MGWMITPVRNSPTDPVMDDYMIWSSIVDAPLHRGTREETIRFWRVNERGRPIHDDTLHELFEMADRLGSSTRLAGQWDDETINFDDPSSADTPTGDDHE